MSGYDGPRIVTDGLVFCVDTTDPNSFPVEPTINYLNPTYDSKGNLYHPSYRPYSGFNHGSVATSTDISAPITGLTVYKVSDDGVDTQNVRTSFKFTSSFLGYDEEYTLSFYVYLTSSFNGRYTNITTDDLVMYQNTTGSDWHSTRGTDPTRGYMGAGTIRTNYEVPNISVQNQWQRASITFKPLTANITIGTNDKNTYYAGYFRVPVTGGTSGGTPYYWYISSAQLEKKIYKSDFVTGIRDFTGSLRNLTNTSNNVNLFGAGVNAPLPTVSGSIGTRNCGVNTEFNTISPYSFSYMTIQNMTTTLKQLLYSDHTIELICKINNFNNVATYNPSLTTQTNAGLIIWNGFHSGLYYSSAGTMTYNIWSGSGATRSTNTGLSSYLGKPTMITATRLSNVLYIYINGDRKVATSITPPLSYNYQNIQLGCAYAGQATVNSYVWPANVTYYSAKLYNRGFTASDVKQNYNSVKTKYNI